MLDIFTNYLHMCHCFLDLISLDDENCGVPRKIIPITANDTISPGEKPYFLFRFLIHSMVWPTENESFKNLK